ncbi:cell wall-binding repeat-containing protein [Herbiconiux sp. A18JL235]|uniref:Cell wall-binding repeat-containing protein n=1 Tax=Herbiconiux sp. A18JL235 TaxID=3152363 RepID=A0AB39BBE4_9MICO
MDSAIRDSSPSIGSRRRTLAASVIAAMVIGGGLIVSAPAVAAVTAPVPSGVYVSSPWVEPGGRVSVAFVGDDECPAPQGASFTSEAGTTALTQNGFGESYWIYRDYAFVDGDGDPLPLGEDAPVHGTLTLDCGDSSVSLPLTVSPTPPETIYNSPTAWTWYTPGSASIGSEVVVNALGFAPGETVTVSLIDSTRYRGDGDVSSASAIPVSVTADGEGAITAEVTLPGGWAPSDVVDLVAAGSESGYLLVSGEGQPINGIAALDLDTDGLAVPGGSLAVSASGFEAGETVTVALHSDSAPARPLGTLTAGADGAVSGSVGVPADTALGGYRVWAGASSKGYLLITAELIVGESERIAASDRYSSAVDIARAAYPGTADVVYVATGASYPDALGAGAAAAEAGGPLLLTAPNELPAAVKKAISALSPARIVVVGGPNSVSEAVVKQLRTLAPKVERQSGADRYASSRAIVENTFDSASTAFIATGATFPDALSATSAAASKGAPVLLIPGTASAVDAETLALLDRLGVTQVAITGGPNSVSPAIESQLAAQYGASKLSRLGGADRYAASATVNLAAFGSASEAFLATGVTFPDALAGGVLAATKSAPLLVVHGDCVPSATIDALHGWGVTKVTLLGGPASLSSAVETLHRCS